MNRKMMIDANVAEQRIAAGDFRGPGLFEVTHADSGTAITNVRRLAGADREPGSVFIGAGTVMLGLLGAGLLYVSFSAQFTYIFAAKHQHAASIVQALMLDVGMIIFAVLGLGLSRQGKPSRVERSLIMVCAALSAATNYAASDTASPRSVVAFTAAPVFLAIVTDRVIAVVRRHVLGIDEASAWTALGRILKGCARLSAVVLLYGLRFVLAAPETARGLRRMVLDAAPVPGIVEVEAEPAGPELTPAPDLPAGVFFRAHGGITPHLTFDHAGQLALCTACPLDVSDGEEPPEFGSKREAFEWHYRRHPQFGDREAMSQVARVVGEAVGLQWGTSRTYAAAILAADAISDAMDAAREEEAQ